MRQVTLAELRESIRTRYDLPTFSTSTKPALAQVDVLMNASAARLSGVLSEAYGDDYFTTATMVQTTIDSSLTSLPTNFYKLRSLIWLQSADRPVEIRRASIEDYARRSLMPSQSWANEPPAYRFSRNSQLWWLPRPNAIYDVTCTYVQTPLTLANDSDTVNVGPGWEEWLVNDVCVRLAQIREEDPGVYMAERADSEQRIRAQAPDRTETEPFAVRDTWGLRGRMGDHEYREWLTRHG